MATAPVTDEVDHHVLVELIAVVHSQLGNEYHRLWVITIDVEYGRLNHLGNIGAVLRGARVSGLTGCETDLIIKHDVQGAAGAISTGLGHLERFHDDSLTREGSVAMQHDGNDCLPVGIIAAILSCPHRTFYNRRHNLQMRRIEGQRQVHFASRRHHVR